MNKKEWHWMSDFKPNNTKTKTKIGLQGSDYYKPINTNKNGK